MDAVTYSIVQATLTGTMDRVCDDHAPIIITRNGHALPSIARTGPTTSTGGSTKHRMLPSSWRRRDSTIDAIPRHPS